MGAWVDFGGDTLIHPNSCTTHIRVYTYVYTLVRDQHVHDMKAFFFLLVRGYRTIRALPNVHITVASICSHAPARPRDLRPSLITSYSSTNLILDPAPYKQDLSESRVFNIPIYIHTTNNQPRPRDRTMHARVPHRTTQYNRNTKRDPTSRTPQPDRQQSPPVTNDRSHPTSGQAVPVPPSTQTPQEARE